jgi:hypothetical protein
MELIIFREIQADSIGLIRQEVIKHGELYRYLEISISISGKQYSTYKEAMEHYENSYKDILKALQTMDLSYQVL